MESKENIPEWKYLINMRMVNRSSKRLHLLSSYTKHNMVNKTVIDVQPFFKKMSLLFWRPMHLKMG